jgi:polar amino acid transport system substrate-binding protein
MNTSKNPQQRSFSFASAALAAALLFCAAAAPAQAIPNGNASASESEAAPESEADMLYLLLTIQANTQGTLNDLGSDVANASQDLSATGLNGTAAREVLTSLLETNSNLIEAATFSKEGRIIVSEGKGGGRSEGADISGQENIARVLKAKIPAFSRQFLLVEGYNGTALAYPVFSPQGELLGGISAIIEPEKLLNALIAPQLHFDIYAPGNATDYTLWGMDLYGLLLYDEDVSQIGNNLFEDPLYRPFPSLLDLGHRIVAERSGHGYYGYFQIALGNKTEITEGNETEVTEGNKTEVNKECYWTTAGLHGREWRHVVTKIV